MNLFALTSVPGQRIIRFPLTNELNQEVAQTFRDQFSAFTAGIVETIPFDGRYRPSDGELLSIGEFADVDGLADAIANPLTIQQYQPGLHQLARIKALFTGDSVANQPPILIQLFESRRLIATGGLLAMYFAENVFERMRGAGLMLDNKLLAVLDGGALKFQSFHFVRRVFDMSEYFNEATAEDIRTFSAHTSLAVESVDDLVGATSTLVRSKIAVILQSGVLEKFSLAELLSAAGSLQVRIDTNAEGKIIVPTDKTALRRLLRFLEEDYYESALSRTRYLANSKRVAD